MKVLLINPPVNINEVYHGYGSVAPKLPPLGLCYIASVLEKNGYTVRILDALILQMSYDEIEKEIGKYKPDAVGMTAMTTTIPRASSLAGLLKSSFPTCLVLLTS